MASAKFIIESLHSISVDFTRILDGNVSDKIWQAYKEGDSGVFTRRLVKLKDRIPVDKIRNKYTDDMEFRTYIQRYFRQFEEIFDQAQETDHGDLLTSTFMSSDIGKLYLYLCATLGRDAQGQDAININRQDEAA
jgi:hypothetical protein